MTQSMTKIFIWNILWCINNLVGTKGKLGRENIFFNFLLL